MKRKAFSAFFVCLPAASLPAFSPAFLGCPQGREEQWARHVCAACLFACLSGCISFGGLGCEEVGVIRGKGDGVI